MRAALPCQTPIIRYFMCGPACVCVCTRVYLLFVYAHVCCVCLFLHALLNVQNLAELASRWWCC